MTAPNPAKKDLPPPPPDILRTRPDPEFPSGVLNVTIHHVSSRRNACSEQRLSQDSYDQAMNVERQNLKGRTGEREGEAGQDTDQASEQADNLPSVCESGRPVSFPAQLGS